MKSIRHSVRTSNTATVALVVSGFIGGLMPIASKMFLRELTPVTALLITLIPMAAVFSPISIRMIRTRKNELWKAGIYGAFWTGNITFFLFGIQVTTAFVSQVLYSLVPLYVLVYENVTGKREFSIVQSAGVLIGIVGIVALSMGSYEVREGIGSFIGIGLLFIASVSWASCILVSKRLSTRFRPLELTAACTWVAIPVATTMVILFDRNTVISQITSLSIVGWIGIAYAAIMIRIVMAFLFNWGIKYGSAIGAAVSSYITPPTTFIAGILLLGEWGNTLVYIGSVMLLTSVYLVTIYRRKSISMDP